MLAYTETRSNSALPNLPIQILHLKLELRLQIRNLLLILKHLIPQLIPLIHHQPVLPPQLLHISLTPLPNILINLIRKMLIQILSHLQLLLHYLQLVLQRLIHRLVLYVF